MSVTGTLALDGLTGAFDVVAGYPVELVGNAPIYNADSTVTTITSATGAARGIVVYDIET
jgi:hypothetical protein